MRQIRLMARLIRDGARPTSRRPCQMSRAIARPHSRRLAAGRSMTFSPAICSNRKGRCAADSITVAGQLPVERWYEII